MPPKNAIWLWYGGTVLDAATFCAATFPDSEVRAVHRAPGDYPPGKEGDAIAHPYRAVARRAFKAMMTMRKIDVAAIAAAVRG